ncbi:hypothetical protein UCRPC4_g00861 [Phaeomoniella chlamydospora]|uniref:Nucleolar 27S pre-rRNA processing Urb2/Npa2 C-terminal domain-containing protein n=1 Tax=Phaeomoniella chlamydospora TaxID=158046 RepID=A0A0G2GWN1_PHACM|nr:hypothetical protein UCRPC4_g00861 [Phaeomoniella chlamydospora]
MTEGLKVEFMRRHETYIFNGLGMMEFHVKPAYWTTEGKMVKEKAAPSAQQALLGLERSTLSVEEQLDEAFRILNIQVKDLEEASLEGEEAPGVSQPRTFAPKEEWVLRWLLKRIRSTFDKSSKYSTSHKTWLLLNYVISRIPTKALGKVLKEADFLSLLNTAVSEVYITHEIEERWFQKPRVDQLSNPIVGDVTANDSVRKESLKRKRSSADDTRPAKRPDNTKTASNDSSLYFGPIVTLLGYCASWAMPAGEDSNPESQQLRLALKGQPETVASLLAKLLGAADLLGNVTTQRAEAQSSKFHTQLAHVLNIWSLRSRDDESDSIFVKHLLAQCLVYIYSIRISPRPSEKSRVIIGQLERMVALHVAQPLKLELQRVSAGTPSSSTLPNETAVNSVLGYLGSAFQVSSGEKGRSVAPSQFPGVESILLEIAIRSVPRGNVRKQQQENPWLQSLFLALSQLSGCPVLSSAVNVSPSESSLSCLKHLLGCANKFNVRLDEVYLTEICSKYAGFTDAGRPCQWDLVSLVVAQDPMIFAGFSEPESLLYKLIGEISIVEAPLLQYGTMNISSLTESILKPILSAFARARQLPNFLDLWRQELIRAFRTESQEESAKIAFWTDESVFEEVTTAAKGKLTSSMVQSELTRMLRDIQESNSDIFARCADLVICDAILSSNPREFAAISSSLVDIAPEVSNTITEQSSHYAYTWRAYRFLHHLHSVLIAHNQPSPLNEPPKELRKHAHKLVTNVLALKGTFTSNAAMSALESFRFLAVTHRINEKSSKKRNATPMEALAAALDRLDADLSSLVVWDGRTSSMTNMVDLMFACLTVLLEHPEPLTSSEEDAVILLRALTNTAQKIARAPSSYSDVLTGTLVAFAQDERFTKVSGWSTRLLSITIESVQKSGTLSTPLLKALISLSMEGISRKKKAEVSGLILHMLKDEQQISDGYHRDFLAVLCRVAETADSSAKLISNEKELWKLSTIFSDKRKYEFGDLELLERLCDLVLDRKLKSIDSQTSQEYLRGILDSCCKYIQKSPALDSSTGEVYICRSVIKRFMLIGDHIKHVVSTDALDKLCKGFLESLASNLRSSSKGHIDLHAENDRRRLHFVLSSLPLCSSVGRDPKELHRSLSKLEKKLEDIDRGSLLINQLQFLAESAKLRLTKQSSEFSTNVIAEIVKYFTNCVNIEIATHEQLATYIRAAKDIVSQIPEESIPLLLSQLQGLELSGSSGIQGGYIAPDVRDVLIKQGIWTVLESITKEGMRVMNAQLPTGAERGVWKEIWQEWKREGKWMGD